MLTNRVNIYDEKMFNLKVSNLLDWHITSAVLCDVIAICLHVTICAIRLFKLLFHINAKCISKRTTGVYILRRKRCLQVCVLHNLYSRLRLSLLRCIFNKREHTHTHPFNGPFSGTTQVSQYQKGKSNLDFTEARDSEWQWHQLGHMRVCISIQTDNHASTTQRKVFCRPDALPAAQPTASKHWRQKALKAKQQKGTTPKILPLLSGVSGHLIHGSFGPPENPSSNSIS